MTIPGVPDQAGLRVGFVPGVTLTKWRTIWRQRFPQVPLDAVEVPVAEQRRVLDTGDVDMCFVRLPVDADGLHVIRLYDEVPVVLVSKDHPLADFDEVTGADLAGESVLENADAASIDLVLQEQAVLRVPMSIARTNSRRDLVYRTVTDAPATTVALAWRIDNQHASIDEFIGVVRGRTANSSRTAQDRAAGQQTDKQQVSKQQVGKKPKPSAAAKRGRPKGRGPGQRHR